MKVWVVVCQHWLRGHHPVHVVGVYGDRRTADAASREDQFTDCEGVRFGYQVVGVEVEVASRWERAWRWLEGWVDATPYPPGRPWPW